MPTCFPEDRLETVVSRLAETEYELCVVISPQRVVLGTVRGKALKAPPDTLVEAVMDPAPSTYRPNVSVEEMIEHMRKNRVRDALVSTTDGVLIGLLRQSELEKFGGPLLAADGTSWKSVSTN